MVRTLCFVFVLGVSGMVTAADPLVWHADYNSARKEAEAKKLPMLVVVGTESCYYCKKMESTTFQDVSVISAVVGKFITLKIDANRDPLLTNALKVQQYPTCVLAGPDGKIHGFVQGYASADDLKTHLSKTIEATTTPEILLKNERKLQMVGKARADFSQRRYADFLEGVNMLQKDGYTNEAKTLKNELQVDPEKLAIAASKERDRTVALYVATADAYARQGKVVDAVLYWELVVKWSPVSPEGMQAQVELNRVAKTGRVNK